MANWLLPGVVVAFSAILGYFLGQKHSPTSRQVRELAAALHALEMEWEAVYRKLQKSVGYATKVNALEEGADPGGRPKRQHEPVAAPPLSRKDIVRMAAR